MRRQPGDSLSTLQQGVNRSEFFANNFLNPEKTAANAFLGKVEDRSFGFVQDFIGRVRLFGGFRNRCC